MRRGTDRRAMLMERGGTHEMGEYSGFKGKLIPRHVGLFSMITRVGPVAYHL